MAKKKSSTRSLTASGRGGKLKVFRTPIGFHDAYVAAPSQKAALEAWGAESNLFAQGIAEQVTEPELMADALERPGEVVKTLRGSAEEQLAAAGRDQRARAKDRPSPRPSPASGRGGKEKPSRPAAKKPRPRPSRAALDQAEQRLKQAEQEHRQALQALREEEEALAARRRQLEQDQARELGKLRAAREKARNSYQGAMTCWAESI